MKRPIYAASLSVTDIDSEVFVEMRDETGALIALAGLKICAAVDFNEKFTDACKRALAGNHPAGAVH